jgi:hypothetical protein
MKLELARLCAFVGAATLFVACGSDDEGGGGGAGGGGGSPTADAGPGGEPAPVGGEPAPVGGEPAPVGGEPAPVGGEPAPVGGEPVPVGGDPGPVGGDPGPVGGDPGPVGGDPGPVGGEPGPVGGDPGPVGGEPPPPGPTQEDVARIFSARCNGCHIGGRSGEMSLAGDFTGETVDVPSTAAILDRIEPGSRADSYLYRKVEGTQGAVSGGGGGRMPLGGQLTAEELETIGLWIDSL